MNEARFELAFTLEPQDYRAMMRAYWGLMPARRAWVRSLRGLSLVGAALAALSWRQTQETADAVLAAALLAAPLLAPLLNRFYYDGVFRRRRLGAGPTLVKADERGLAKSGPNGVSRFAWKRVRRVVAARRAVLIWISPDQAVIVPHRAFAAEADLHRFLAFAQSHAAGDPL